MKIISAIALLASISPALGTVSTYSQEWCTTSSGSTQPVTLSTTTYASTTSLVVYATSTATLSTTVTPPSIITTTTISLTVATTATQSTETSIIFTTTTITTTSTATEAEITTTTAVQTPTTTVPTSSGFTPILSVKSRWLLKTTSSSAAPTKRVKQRVEGQERRAATVQAESSASSLLASESSTQNRGSGYSRPRHPTIVTCRVLVEVVSTSTIVYTASNTVSVTVPTSTVTSTVMVTTTATLVPEDAPTTLSFLTTSTISTTTVSMVTTTSTTTNTVTSIAPTSTFYAACNPDNVASSIGGLLIQFAQLHHSMSFPRRFATGYDCCVDCVTTPNCGGTYYYAGNEEFPPQCYLLNINGQGVGYDCEPQKIMATFELVNGTNESPLDTYSNGNCGQWAYKLL